MTRLFFIYSLSAGGAERVTATLANYWAEHGHEVVIVTIAGADRDFYDLRPTVRRVSLDLDAKSGNVFEAMMNNWRRTRRLRAVIRQEDPDVAIAMMPTANILLALAVAGTGTAAIGAERVYPPGIPLGWPRERLRRHLYGRLDGLVAQTGPIADWLTRNTGARADRITVIPNPLTLPLSASESRLAATEPKDATGCDRLLLAVGRLERQKGFDRLISAFADLAGEHPEWALAILGEGRERDALETQCRERGMEGRVRLPGTVGNIGDWYEAADLYALTSRFEGFPNTLLEALAHGLPAVAVDCETGPREIVRHDVDGLLVPQNDQPALVGALNRLMGDQMLRERLGTRAVEARERFSVARIADQWEKVFTTVQRG